MPDVPPYRSLSVDEFIRSVRSSKRTLNCALTQYELRFRIKHHLVRAELGQGIGNERSTSGKAPDLRLSQISPTGVREQLARFYEAKPVERYLRCCSRMRFYFVKIAAMRS